MLVLGINDGHDAGACLVDENGVLAAVSEERLTRRKRQAGFPYEAIRSCLSLAGVEAGAVDKIVVAERCGRSLHRLLDKRYRQTDPNLPMNRRGNMLSMVWQNIFAGNSLFSDLDYLLSRRILRSRFKKLGFTARVEMIDHHRAHAVGAVRGSAIGEALVVTMDAFGDGASCTVSLWVDKELTEILRIRYPHSPALVYGLTTSFLGFNEGEEGQVAGLAASGDPQTTRVVFDKLFSLRGHKLRLRRVPSPRFLRRKLAGCERVDIAAGLQRSVEDTVGEFIRQWFRRTGMRNLCLAGGLFANVRLNQTIAKVSDCENLYVFPHMGDGGLCVGAAWSELPDEIAPAPFDVFVGPQAQSADPSVTMTGVKYYPVAARRLAHILAEGGIVGVCAGRMEFGPRALGNRSLLFSAQSRELVERLGRELARPESMPFAPVVRDIDLNKITADPPRTCLQFMTATVDALPGIAEKFPAAVHADGSMRVQVVGQETAPLLYDILTAYQLHMDPPLLINTSFNHHGEPIIADTERALELFAKLPLSALVAGEQLLVRDE